MPTTRGAPSSCSPRPGIPPASTRAITPATPPSPAMPRPSSTTSARSGYGSSSGRSSAQRSSRATRRGAFVVSGGTYAYGGHADIDGLFREQALELDVKRREDTLHRIQQLVH